LRADLQRLKRDTQSAKIAAVSGTSSVAAPHAAAAAKSKWPIFVAVGGVVAVIAVLAAGLFAGWFGSKQPYSQAQLKPVKLTANSSDDPVSVTSISPDGKYLLYADLEGLHLRLMATGETQSLPIPDEFCFR
jgi:hypothetical protein